MHIKRLVRFCQFILKVLSGNKILTSIKGQNSVKILQKMTGNNPKLGLVNVAVQTKYGQILYICSQDIEWKQSSDINPSRHLTSVGRQIDVRLRRHNDVGFRLILKVCLTSKTDVILTSKNRRHSDVKNRRHSDVKNRRHSDVRKTTLV